MELRDTPEQVLFRREARAFIAAHAPKALLPTLKRLRFAALPFADEHEWITAAKSWQAVKTAQGWGCLVWPKEYGGKGLSPLLKVIFEEEEGFYAALNDAFLISQGFVAPTLMAYATVVDKQRFLPAIADGSQIWCQMFSEPGAGSDLAGVRLKARREGDHWLLDGQKVWTSGAHHSDWGIVLTRTDSDVAKHKGMTMFMVDMRTPGLHVRPIRELNGQAHFNEVFFDAVRLPDSQRLGPVNEGWRVALTTLMNERMAIGAAIPTGIDELLALCLGGDTPAIESEAVRGKLADWYARSSGIRHGIYRQLTALDAGGEPGPEGAVGKLIGGRLTQDIASYGLELLGSRGLSQADADSWMFHQMFAFGALHRLQGGADEILRNVLAERILGLPPEIRMDKGAFKDIATAPSP